MSTPGASFVAHGVTDMQPSPYVGTVKVIALQLVPGQCQIEIEWPPGAQQAGPNLKNAQTEFLQLIINELTALLPGLPG